MTTAEEILADWKDKLSIRQQKRNVLQTEIDVITCFISDIQDLVMEQRKVEEER